VLLVHGSNNRHALLTETVAQWRLLLCASNAGRRDLARSCVLLAGGIGDVRVEPANPRS
jgi:hypothetical protein